MVKNSCSRILLTMGEPAGIGPELLVRIAQNNFDAQVIVLASSNLLQLVAEKLSLSLVLKPMDWQSSPTPHTAGELYIENVKLPEGIECGHLNKNNSESVLKMLTRAGELALSNQVKAIVTAPVHKAILNMVAPSFLGHTEFFAEQASVGKVVMMLATERLRVTLATTHIPLSQVTNTIDQSLLEKVMEVIDSSFETFGLVRPKIAVCGINPHAGEDGLLGNEDQNVVATAIESVKIKGIQAYGPFPSDSLFTQTKRDLFDVFLAMYHDQGLPVVKAIGFGQSANITLGLPYIRTSVDHGTALDIADQYVASPDSFNYAINYAIQLAKGVLPR
jgi:4-hydroxythreonine-4-phosphate dehydrogenase